MYHLKLSIERWVKGEQGSAMLPLVIRGSLGAVKSHDHSTIFDHEITCFWLVFVLCKIGAILHLNLAI